MPAKTVLGARVKLRDCDYNRHMERVGMLGIVTYSRILFKDPSIEKNCNYEIKFDNGETDYFRACEFDLANEQEKVAA